jgi:hypothetical protein
MLVLGSIQDACGPAAEVRQVRGPQHAFGRFVDLTTALTQQVDHLQRPALLEFFGLAATAAASSPAGHFA